MSVITFSLISHVVIGLIGVMATYMVLMGLLKHEIPIRTLKISSLIAFLSYILSWLGGGYYYVVRYGAEVKPVIKAGDYPWAHAVFTETKEHVFLFLPILALVLLMALWMRADSLNERSGLRKALVAIASISFAIGLFVTISGIVMSGAAR